MIQAGIVGVGYWGPNLLRNMVENGQIRVKWICDLNKKPVDRMTQRYPFVKGTSDFKDLVNDPALELIVVATPAQSHAELAIAALKAGKHVLVTKPMAMTSADCERMIAASEKHKRMLMVDHTFVYHPAIIYLRSLVESKAIGAPLYFQSVRMNLGLYQPDVSVIYDLMAHDLSILNDLIKEEPVEASVTAKHAAKLPQPDIAYLQLNYQSNFMASVQASWLSPLKVRQTFLIGSKKMLVYDDNDVVQKVKIFDKGVDTAPEALKPQDKEAAYTRFIQYRQGDVHSPAIAATEALKIEMEHLVDCLTNNKKPRSDGYEGLRVVRLLEFADSLARNSRSWSTVPGSLRTALKAA